LSVLHTPHYPYATSRDTTAAGFLSEVGLSPLDVDEIALVIRSFPIRVPGHSGPLEGECSWDEVTAAGAAPERLEEITSVTKSVRRVARFSPEIVRDAIASNQPTLVILNHVDYWDHSCRGGQMLTERVCERLASVENAIAHRIDLVGTDERSLSTREQAKKAVAG
jgi:adenylosuccinate synthase